MTNDTMPGSIQALGLACVPVQDIDPALATLARRPVAAAVLTLQRRGDGHRELVATTLSDARDTEFPLPHLLEKALVAGAPAIVSAADRTVLAVEATARRYWAEPRLAALCAGNGAIEPALVAGGTLVEEAALCRRLQIPLPLVSNTEVERTWSRHAPEAAMEVALGHAIARLMLWAHGRAFATGEPDVFFETLLPLRDWMLDHEECWPSLKAAARSRPVMRAMSFAGEYRRYRDARDGGDGSARWISFEDGLFHV